MSENKLDARDRITKALVRLRSRPELMGIGSMLNLIRNYEEISAEAWPGHGMPTMATDGEKVLYHPPFVDEITDAELRFVLIHEAMHIAYGHTLRFQPGMRHDVANIAMDHIVNNLLKSSEAYRDGFLKMPFEDRSPCDPKYTDHSKWTFELVYRDLMKNPPPEQPKNSAGQGQPGGPGDAPGQCLPSPALGDPEKAKDLEEKVKQAIADGRFMDKSWGQGGGTDSLLGVIDEGRYEDVSSWEFLKEVLIEHYAYIRTWARPNLALSDSGYFPARDKASGTIHFVIDVSGSVSDEELKIYLANSTTICEAVGIQTVKVAYADHRVRKNDEGEYWTEFDIKGGDDIAFKIPGRGGTDFTPIFEVIEEEMEEVQALIYFTDGWGHCRADEPDFPVVWASTDGPPRWFKDNADYEDRGFGIHVPITPVRY